MEKDNKKNLILETAKNMILTDGYSRISINNLTNQCKISKGSFYTYFESKEEMLFILIEEYEVLIKRILDGFNQNSKNLDDFLENCVKYRASFSEQDLKMELVIFNLNRNLEIIDKRNFKKLLDIDMYFTKEIEKKLKEFTDIPENMLEKYSKMIFGIGKFFSIFGAIDENDATQLKFKDLKKMKKYLKSNEVKENIDFVLQSIRKIIKN